MAAGIAMQMGLHVASLQKLSIISPELKSIMEVSRVRTFWSFFLVDRSVSVFSIPFYEVHLLIRSRIQHDNLNTRKELLYSLATG